VDFFAVSGQRWDVSDRSRLRVAPVIAWTCGFVAYQLVYPGTVPGWADLWTTVSSTIGFVAPSWLGSSVAAIVVGGLVMLVLGRLTRRRAS
jgi:nucleobase:cation symporter-1, NCS1 family